MIRFASLTATALSLAALTPAAALAQSGGYYAATAAVAPKKASFVTANTVWKCNDGVCTAPKTPTQDKVMCERAAARIGALSAFSAGSTAFDAAALEACNARAK
ncbi:CC_3452 family protein [Sphingomonas turrisvirgatae]|uniref:Uncharacterized protein n=1 Tax=Sphingomonas turrisvirgatae TaxID=1888892 RepID=A0A1E3LU01_9SPHN|nr:hypothetical protein [Sphingomonas turrisvirgatae]ODP37228.1 hypothetical protein BFL28_03105 [Sphingomonas turrisvirgatae]